MLLRSPTRRISETMPLLWMYRRHESEVANSVYKMYVFVTLLWASRDCAAINVLNIYILCERAMNRDKYKIPHNNRHVLHFFHSATKSSSHFACPCIFATA